MTDTNETTETKDTDETPTLAEILDELDQANNMMGILRERLAGALDNIGNALLAEEDGGWPDLDKLSLAQKELLVQMASAVATITNVRQCLETQEGRVFRAWNWLPRVKELAQ